MKQFEYFDHTADTLFRAYGRTFEEALGNCILAVYNVIVDTASVKGVKQVSFSVTAEKKETLVYELIEELLFRLDTESFLCSSVKNVSFHEQGKGFVAAVMLLGDTDASAYDVFGQIKAPTYSEMLISEKKDNVFIQAVLDL